MELIVLAIVISVLLAFYPIRVKPRANLVTPTAISTTISPSGENRTLFFDPHNMPGTYKSSSSFSDCSKRALRCSLCDADCELCGSCDCGEDFYICSWCCDQGVDSGDDCPYCGPIFPEPGDTRLLYCEPGESLMSGSDHFSSDVFISDDFDSSIYRRNDYLMPTSSSSDLAVGQGQVETEVFYFEGRRYIAATYNDILVIRPDF